MSCALTQGYTLDCKDNVGGIKEVYIAEIGNITSVGVSSGTISAITVSTGKQFWNYQLEKETGSLVEHIHINDANGTVFYEQDIDFTIRKMVANYRNEIRQLAQLRLIMIVKDRNGKYWLCGQTNGMELQNSDAKTGKAMGDQNGYSLKFKGKEELPMCEVSSGIIAALLAPAV